MKIDYSRYKIPSKPSAIKRLIMNTKDTEVYIAQKEKLRSLHRNLN